MTPDNAAPVDAVERPQTATPLWPTLRRMAQRSGRSPLALLAEYLRLHRGPGKLLLPEYVGMRLFDRDLYLDVDLTKFVGFHGAEKIWLRSNFRVDVFGLVNNKVASDILFAAHGFPILPTIAMYREGVGLETPFLMRTVPELRAFLTSPDNFPLFGKPISGHQSLGSASLDHYDADRDCLVTTTRMPFALNNFIAFVQKFAGSGYIFQRRASPHAAIRALCGERLSTVRVLTASTPAKCKILRACWKIPAGINMADNFWRAGNLLAQLDIATGKVGRVLRGDGLFFEEVTHHPDSGLPLVGTVVPNWPEVARIALEASRIVPEIPLVGWDIAPTDDGAVLVELNETPDFRLHQIADRRGILDDDMCAFLAERDRERAIWFKAVKQHRSGS